jgi:hypothetical protein
MSLPTPVRQPWPRNPKYLVGEDGSIVGPSGRALRMRADRDGYLRFNIWNAERRMNWPHLAHVLVCETFHGERSSPGHEVAHKDGDPGNNRAENLRWSTHAENVADILRHGRRQSPLTVDDVEVIRSTYASSARSASDRAALAEQYGLSVSGVEGVLYRRSWKES